jgi:hypothetical protein
MPDLIDFFLYCCYGGIFKHKELSNKYSSVIINKTAIAIITVTMFKSLLVLSVDVAFEPFMLLIAPENVETIRGSDFIRLMIPPAARAPAPIYLMSELHIALAPPDAKSSPIVAVV